MSKTEKIIENTDEKESSLCEELLSGEICKDAVKYAPSKIFGTAMNLVAVSVYTNLLSPDKYGLYMLTTSIISLFAIIFSDWVGISALRFFREHFKNSKVEHYFSTILFLLVTNLLMLYIIGFLFYKPLMEFFKIPINYLIAAFALIIPISARALLFQVLRAQIKPLSYTFSAIFNQLATILVAVFLIKEFHLSAIAILIGMAVSISLIDIVLLLQTKFHKSINHEKIHFEIFSKLYKYGVPIAASSFGIWMTTQVNRLVLQYYKGSYYNGQLGVGYNLTYSIMMPLFAIITLAAIPRIINHYEDKKDVCPIISKLIGIYFSLFMPMTLFLCFYPQETVLFFSNKNFENAHILLPFLALSAFCLGLTELTTLKYYLVKKTEIDMALRLSSGVAGLILNFILLPKYGLWAVGFAALFSQLLYLALSFIINVENIKSVFPYKQVLKVFTSIVLTLIISKIFISGIFAENMVGFILNILIALGLYVFFMKIVLKKAFS